MVKLTCQQKPQRYSKLEKCLCKSVEITLLQEMSNNLILKILFVSQNFFHFV